MDSQDPTLSEQKQEDPTSTTSKENIDKSQQDKRKSMAKRGLKSLAVMVTVPTLLTLFSTFFSSSSHSYVSRPPLWTLQLTSLTISVLMGFSSWIVWADGGFHRKPRAFQIYATWLLLSVVWGPVVVGFGLSWVGLVVGLGMVGAIFACFRVFKEVSPAAGKLVMPCLVLGGFMALVNLKLVFT